MRTPLGFRFSVVAASLSVSIPTLSAQTTTSPTSMNDPRPMVRAAPRREQIIIDGRLDDAAWKDAQPITDFHQQLPDEGKPPTERTEIRILYDASAIYIGARMYDREAPRRLLVRRDQLLYDNSSDKISFVLDPY